MNRTGRIALVLALVVVVGMAFRVSWNALRDIAGAVGADQTAATLYPFVVDGLMALALVATLVLVGRDRTFALRVLGTYTGASLVLNYVHGLVPALHGRDGRLGTPRRLGPGQLGASPARHLASGRVDLLRLRPGRQGPAPPPRPDPDPIPARPRMRRNPPRPSGNGLWLTWRNRPRLRP